MTAAKMVASIINRAVSCIKPPAKSARLLFWQAKRPFTTITVRRDLMVREGGSADSVRPLVFFGLYGGLANALTQN
jgi:hypothetical protein